ARLRMLDSASIAPVLHVKDRMRNILVVSEAVASTDPGEAATSDTTHLATDVLVSLSQIRPGVSTSIRENHTLTKRKGDAEMDVDGGKGEVKERVVRDVRRWEVGTTLNP